MAYVESFKLLYKSRKQEIYKNYTRKKLFKYFSQKLVSPETILWFIYLLTRHPRIPLNSCKTIL